MFEFEIGSTDNSILLAVEDTNGQPLTTLTASSSGLTVHYGRLRAAGDTAIPLVALASWDAPHADGGFLNLGGGVYRLDLPDGVAASGARIAYVRLNATGARPSRTIVKLLDYNAYAAGASTADIATQVRTTMEAAGSELDNLHARVTAQRAAYLDGLATLPADVLAAVKADPGWDTMVDGAVKTCTATYPAALPGAATVTWTRGGVTVRTETIQLDALGRPTSIAVA